MLSFCTILSRKIYNQRRKVSSKKIEAAEAEAEAAAIAIAIARNLEKNSNKRSRVLAQGI